MNKDEQPPSKEALIKARENLTFIADYLVRVSKVNGLDYTVLAQAFQPITKALDAQIKACDVPKIEGLSEALKDFDDNGSALMDYENTDVLAEAARAYHKLTGGESHG